ncbi:MAG TPA: hypothetical protein VIM10_16960 [Actinopolymorphaceae bacterium]|jgi:hypothetical protein
MRGRSVVVVLAMLSVVAASGCAAAPGTITAAPSSAPGSTAQGGGRAPALPAGWRWESYGGVEVGVPGDWRWDNGSQRIGQWCANPRTAEADQIPAVGRPGVSSLVGCGMDTPKGKPDPSTLLKNTGPIVAFDRPEKSRDGVVKVGDRTTVGLNGVEVTVQVEPELRKEIVATVHAVTVDVNGCPATDPVSRDPARRPAPAGDVSKLANVSAVAACKYILGHDDYGSDPRLQGSLRLDGAKAATAVERIAAAAKSGGPNAPQNCTADTSYGNELIVLRVTSDTGESQVYLRYSSCDHNGFDDGRSVRRLEAKSIAPFIAGPNAVNGSLGATAKLVWPNAR